MIEVEYMSDRQYAAHLAKLELERALKAATIKPRKLPAFKLSDGRILEPKYQMTCRGSVCRAPHKNRR